MSIHDAVKNIDDSLKYLKPHMNTPICGSDVEIKNALENIILQADTIKHQAEHLQRTADELYKRLIDKRGWDPHATYQAEDRVHRIGQPIVFIDADEVPVDEIIESKRLALNAAFGDNGLDEEVQRFLQEDK